MLIKIALKVALAGLVASQSGTVSALDNPWYVGLGGGLSRLQPDTADSAIAVDEKHGQVATLFIGRDIDYRTSGQFQLYTLGEAQYSDGRSTAGYKGGDASVLFRFHDSLDRQPRGTKFSTSFYGRFGFGFMQRTSDLSPDTDNSVFFTAGAGMETYLSYNLAMRLEALFHHKDAGSAMLSLVNRFGGRRDIPAVLSPAPVKPTRPPTPITTDAVETPETLDWEDTAVTSITVQESAVAVPTDLQETYEIPPTESPATDAQPDKTNDVTVIPGEIGNAADTQADPVVVTPPQIDSDADGVLDDRDQCPESAPGYPVNYRGCPAFGGMLPELSFDDRTADISSSSYAALDELARQLKQYPTTYIELVAHTDNTGSEAEQSDLTRRRLRNIGVYLVRHGINQERLLLRSYGGSRPVFDNLTTDGRRRNNRIEAFENP